MAKERVDAITVRKSACAAHEPGQRDSRGPRRSTAHAMRVDEFPGVPRGRVEIEPALLVIPA
jgi:hypothetical protein